MNDGLDELFKQVTGLDSLNAFRDEPATRRVDPIEIELYVDGALDDQERLEVSDLITKYREWNAAYVNSLTRRAWERKKQSTNSHAEDSPSINESPKKQPAALDAIEQRWQVYTTWVLAMAWGVAERWECLDDRRHVQSVIERFRNGTKTGRYSLLKGDYLWRHIISLARKQMSQTSESPNLQAATETAVGSAIDTEGDMLLESNEFTEQLANVILDCMKITAASDDRFLEQITYLSLENFAADQIADQLHEGVELIEISLRRIRKQWAPESTSEAELPA